MPPKMLRSWIEARLGAEMVRTENEAGELLADFATWPEKSRELARESRTAIAGIAAECQVNEVASDAAHSEARPKGHRLSRTLHKGRVPKAAKASAPIRWRNSGVLPCHVQI